MLHTNSEADLLLLVGESIEIVEVELWSTVLVGQQLPLQAKQHAEVAFTAHHPDGVLRSLQVTSYLRRKNGTSVFMLGKIISDDSSTLSSHQTYRSIRLLKGAQELRL